jgi:hypothetical protein
MCSTMHVLDLRVILPTLPDVSRQPEIKIGICKLKVNCVLELQQDLCGTLATFPTNYCYHAQVAIDTAAVIVRR